MYDDNGFLNRLNNIFDCFKTIEEAGNRVNWNWQSYLTNAINQNEPDPESGRTTNDLQLTRFPLGIGGARRDAVLGSLSGSRNNRKKISDVEEVLLGNDDKIAIVVDSDSFNAPLKDVVIDKILYSSADDPKNRPWTENEVILALAPVAAAAVRKSSNVKAGTESFNDAIQDALTTIFAGIKSQDDRGEPFIAWASTLAVSGVTSGVTLDNKVNGAIGVLGAVTDSGRQDVTTNIPIMRAREKMEGKGPGDFGKYTEDGEQIDRYTEIDNLLQHGMTVFRIGSESDKAQFSKQAHALYNKYQSQEGHTLSTRTGHSALTVQHSDTDLAKYLNTLSNATSINDFANGKLAPNTKNFPKPNKIPDDLPTAEAKQNIIAWWCYTKLQEAFTGRMEYDIYAVKSEIDAFKRKTGSKMTLGRTESTSATDDSDDDAGDRDVAVVPDSFVDNLSDITTVNKILRLGWEGSYPPGDGVLMGTHGGNVVKTTFSTQEVRIINRVFGIKNYFFRNTQNDPELDIKKLSGLRKKLTETVESLKQLKETLKQNESAEVNFNPEMVIPVSKDEVRELIEMAATNLTDEYEEYKINLAQLKEDYESDGDVPVIPSDDDEVAEWAERLSMSLWVRMGCPAMDIDDIDKELTWHTGKYSSNRPHELKAKFLRLIGQSSEIFKEPPGERGRGTPDSKKQNKIVQPGSIRVKNKDFREQSKLYKIAAALWNDGYITRDELGSMRVADDFGDDYPAKKTKTESALIKLMDNMIDTRKQAILTEGINSIDGIALQSAIMNISRKLICSYFGW